MKYIYTNMIVPELSGVPKIKTVGMVKWVNQYKKIHEKIYTCIEWDGTY